MRLYGNDMDDRTTPFEAGLGWTVSLEKDFIGAPALRQAQQPSRLLAGVRMLDRTIPRHGYPVLNDGQPVGAVASGNVSFTLGHGIAMVYAPVALTDVGTRLAIEVRGTAAPAEVVALPFYKRPHPK